MMKRAPKKEQDLDNLLKRVEELQDLVEKARKPTMDFLKSRGSAPPVSKQHYEEVYPGIQLIRILFSITTSSCIGSGPLYRARSTT